MLESFKKWEVAREFAEPFYNYLIHGFNPGGCFTSVLANDFYGAISRSHPSNTIEALKAVTGWIYSELPREAYGSYDAVSNWCYFTAEQRRSILERHGMLYTEEQEVMMTLCDQPTQEPVLY
jgi:hypothetical protein